MRERGRGGRRVRRAAAWRGRRGGWRSLGLPFLLGSPSHSPPVLGGLGAVREGERDPHPEAAAGRCRRRAALSSAGSAGAASALGGLCGGGGVLPCGISPCEGLPSGAPEPAPRGGECRSTGSGYRPLMAARFIAPLPGQPGSAEGTSRAGQGRVGAGRAAALGRCGVCAAFPEK